MNDLMEFLMAVTVAPSFDFYQAFIDTLKSGVLTLLAVITAIGIFFYQQNNEKRKFNERIQNACKALLTDLGQIEEFYSSSEDKMTISLEDDIEYTNTSIGVEYYQSIVNSGLITYFDERTQVELRGYCNSLFVSINRIT
jgi:flagellar basal body-associated protein FliL